MKLNFTKMQGCGNDYVYVDCTKEMLQNPEKIARYVSERHTSVGADGLILICPSDKADFRMDMYNADGSQAQMCGNGIRCVAKFVHDRGLTDKNPVKIETLAGVKEIELVLGEDGKVAEAIVDMGEPIVRTKLIPMISDHFVFMDQGLDIDMNYERVVNGTAVSMGNPHFVIFVEDVENCEFDMLGPKISKHPLFPEGTNVEFVQVIDKNTVKYRVYERGSGETWACGTGAAALCFVSVSLSQAGKEKEWLTIHAKGGTLQAMVGKKGHIFLKGPATTVYEGECEIPDNLE